MPRPRSDQIESDHGLVLSLEHDLFGKPASTFPDHALSGRGMNQFLKPTVACLAVLGMFGMQGLCAQDDPDHTAALQSTADHSGR